MMANLLEDLLPDAPREAGILSAAARRDVAGMLREHAERGLDSETSVRLVAAALASSTAFGPEACRWAVREFAVAMGVLVVGTVPSAMPFPGADVDTSARTAAAETATAVPAATSPSPTDRLPGFRAAAGQGQVAAGPPGYLQAGAPGYVQPASPRRRRSLAAMLTAIGIVVAVAAAGAIGYRLAGSPHQSSGHHSLRSSLRDTPAASGSSSPAVTAPPTAAAGTGWIAQLASVEQSAGTAKLGQLLARIQVSVPQAMVLDSSDYASLRPGFWVVYYQANFANGVQALAFCAAHGLTTANQCLGRYLSHSAATFGYQCYPPAGSPSGNCYYRP